MRKKFLAGLTMGIFLVGVAGVANAVPITVSQGGTTLGTIESYSGSLTGAANYSYNHFGNQVINGPTAKNMEGQIFFYEGSDGLSLNIVLGSIGSGPNGSVNWDITISGSTTDPSVLVADDAGELSESSTNNVFNGRWGYSQNPGDGGVIGELSGNSWAISIDQLSYSGVSSLMAYGATNSVTLNMDLGQNIVFTAENYNHAPVPEPASMLLFGTGLASLAGLSVVRKKKMQG